MPLTLRIIVASGILSFASYAADPITDLTALRALPAPNAAAGVPVKFTGTVLGLEPTASFHFFIHDGLAGCFIKTRPGGRPPKLTPGDLVTVDGISDPLGYYPSVREARVKVVGRGTIPKPVCPSAAEMFSPQLDSQWVEVPAVITGLELADERITLALEVHGLPFKAELPVSPDAEERAARLMQRPVLLQGVMGTIFNRQRQMTDRHFFVPSFDSITLTGPPENGETYPLLTVSRLLTGSFGPSVPVRLQGTITQSDPKGFYLRDSSGSTLVQSVATERLRNGTAVEVQGFAAVAPFRPILRATRVIPLGPVIPVAPIPFDFRSSDLSAFHAEWITLDADFLGKRDGPIDGILQFRSGSQFFEALHPNKAHVSLPPLAVGDRVRLAGICELTTTHALPRIDWVDGFRIHLPENAELIVLSRAPWWTTLRLLVALGIMSTIAATGFLGTWILRKQVKRQMHVISDKLRSEAVGEERDRMARELHDTLEQQLSGVALQLDSLDHAVTRNPAAASATLSLARRMLRYTRHEARRSVWDLRSKVLESEGLASALRAMAETSATPSGPAVSIVVSGVEKPLPSGADFHLLRIAQEATTNAIKHSAASTIQIHLRCLPLSTHLTITDDGCGFDTATAASPPGPHFGILGMRERAAKIGASLHLQSHLGAGCSISLSLPHDKTHETATHSNPRCR